MWSVTVYYTSLVEPTRLGQIIWYVTLNAQNPVEGKCYCLGVKYKLDETNATYVSRRNDRDSYVGKIKIEFVCHVLEDIPPVILIHKLSV